MDEKRNSMVISVLLLLLFINLVVPVVYLALKPVPAEAASTATYTEDWVADKCLISNVNIYRYGCRNYIADANYVEAAPSSAQNYWAGRVYSYPWRSSCNYGWNLSPHGLVTQWSVTGKLTQN